MYLGDVQTGVDFIQLLLTLPLHSLVYVLFVRYTFLL
jgi:hypothetical protein